MRPLWIIKHFTGPITSLGVFDSYDEANDYLIQWLGNEMHLRSDYAIVYKE